ncbi:MAG: hypothetical protein M1569_01495 [Candidatus Marsarchaeota archaeon]|nr:hypothetical protein [Candidatus Marsarchaeota archaeon]
MDKKQLGRMAVIREIDRISEAVNGLEEFALAFPESRDDVLDLIDHSFIKDRRCNRVLRATKVRSADRIAAVEMLEILNSD